MTSAAAVAIARRPDPLDVFVARCVARAKLHAAGEIELQEAVDELQFSAVRYGLVAKLGQDRVQAIIADAFHPVREALGDFDVVPDAPEEPRNKRAAESTVEALCYALRTDGVDAFQRADTQQRMRELSAAQIAMLIERLAQRAYKLSKHY